MPETISKPAPLNLKLADAAFIGDAAEVGRLLRVGTPADSRDWNGSTPLILASAAGHLDIVKMLVESKADVNARADWGDTPFDRAAAYGHRDVMLFLYESGADKDAKGQFGRTALDWTAAFRPSDAAFIMDLKRGR